MLSLGAWCCPFWCCCWWLSPCPCRWGWCRWWGLTGVGGWGGEGGGWWVRSAEGEEGGQVDLMSRSLQGLKLSVASIWHWWQNAVATNWLLGDPQNNWKTCTPVDLYIHSFLPHPPHDFIWPMYQISCFFPYCTCKFRIYTLHNCTLFFWSSPF